MKIYSLIIIVNFFLFQSWLHAGEVPSPPGQVRPAASVNNTQTGSGQQANLNNEQQTVEQAEEVNLPGHVIFKIFTNPGKAEVYLNRRFLGETPLNKIRAKKGKYDLLIYREGYKAINEKLDLNENNKTYEFNLEKLAWEPKKNEILLKYSHPFFSILSNASIKNSIFFSYKYFFPESNVLKNFDFEFETGLIYMSLKYNENGFPNAGDTSLTIVPISISMHYNFFRSFAWVCPYLGVGAGATIFNVAINKYERTSLMAMVKAGINFFIQSPVSFQVEVRYCWLGRYRIPTDAVNTVVINYTDNNLDGFILSFALVGRF